MPSSLLIAAGHTVSTLGGALNPEDLAARLQHEGVELLGIRSTTQRHRGVLAAAPRLRAIGAFCIGTNQIDLGAAATPGRGGVQRAVLQHPLA